MSYLIKWKCLSHFSILVLDVRVLSLRNTIRNRAVPRKLNVSLPSVLCATWLSQKHTHSENTDVWLLREDVCQPTCFVLSTMKRGRGPCSLLQYKLLQYARHGAWQMSDEAQWLGAGQASTQNTSVETEWKRVSGEELGWAFLSLGHNSLPCKQRKSCRPITGCSTWAKPELQKKGSCSSHQGQLVWHCLEILHHTGVVT